ncbi:MAG: M28 family peptidase [Verrucomicrobia bacterium]|nr:M28 family peptidase [Verrucomicrobiota bacterium]MBI3868415.1 M28 family peptidase [Verrucomicrobiota bacterium]
MNPPARLDDAGEALEAHISFLADDLLEGRGAGTPGHDIAARYVASQFRQSGLRPVGESSAWYQPVPLLEAKLKPDATRLEVVAGGKSQTLDYNLDYVARPHFAETQTALEAPLVFVGFGVHAPELGYDDFPGLDLKGRVAVMLAKAPGRFPATALAHYSDRREKAVQLISRGAVGMVIVPTPKDLEETPWPRHVTQAQFSSMRWLDTNGTPMDGFPASKMSVTLSPRGMSAVFAHSPKPLSAVLETAASSKPQGFPLEASIRFGSQSELRRVQSPNVLGLLPGSDAKLRDECIVLTAHLDHQGRGPAVNGDAIYNGAYDNAIGTAMILEVARALTREGSLALRRSVLFAAVTAEEKGLIGSDYLAQHVPSSAGRAVANINLDMVLVTMPTSSYVVLGTVHSSLNKPVERAASRLGLTLMPDPNPESVGFIRSDQYSFIRQGVPAIAPKVFSPPGKVLAPAGMMSPSTFLKEHYHRPSDDLTLPRDTASAVRCVRFITEIIRQIANNPEPPRWNRGDFFGEKFGSR